jgi:hypothetical protein
MIRAPINRSASGVLDFLDIKSLGKNPQVFGETVQPVLEMREFYQALHVRRWDVAFSTTTIGGQDGVPLVISATTPADLFALVVAGQIVVPQSELWYVERAALHWALPAEAAAYTDAQWNLGARGAIVPWLLTGFQTGAAAAVRRGYRALHHPVWVNPGETLTGFTVGSNSVLATTYSATLSLVRLRL